LLIVARPRSWIRQRAIAMAWVISSLLAICISVWFLLVTTGWIDKFEAAAHHPHLLRRVRAELAAGWRSVGVLVVFGAVTTVGLAAFYRVAVVHPRGGSRRVWSGSLVARQLWALVCRGVGV